MEGETAELELAAGAAKQQSRQGHQGFSLGVAGLCHPQPPASDIIFRLYPTSLLVLRAEEVPR